MRGGPVSLNLYLHMHNDSAYTQHYLTRHRTQFGHYTRQCVAGIIETLASGFWPR
jgi:hypothetical protein